MNKSAELINSLMNGELLEKKYDIGESQYLFYDKEYGFEVKGWGSAYGKEEDRIMELLLHPEHWIVSENKVEDYPWSVLAAK